MSHFLYFFNYLKSFASEWTFTRAAGYVCFYAICLVCLNYYIDFEDGILDPFIARKGFLVRTLVFFAFHGFVYFGCILILFYKQKLSATFWKLSSFGILALSADRALNLSYAIHKLLPKQDYVFYYKIINFGSSFVIGCLFLLLGWRYLVKAPHYQFGLGTKNSNLKPYLLLLLLMVPILFIAGTQADFLKVYPKFPDQTTPSLLNILWFESFYGLDFLKVEFTFRGFFVLALMRFLGPSVLLPMAVLYTAIHFGKPLGEAVSSFFGGFILGIFTYYTKSIWGGILIHLGVAWLMELSAFVVPLLF